MPWTRRIIFPPDKLSKQFGPGDAGYAWQVFEHHSKKLLDNGYCGAKRIVEAGPGRNIGTSLLFWSRETALQTNDSKVSVVLWDVIANAQFNPNTWKDCAKELLDYSTKFDNPADTDMLHILADVAEGRRTPNIHYLVCHHSHLQKRCKKLPFDLVYSQAALEHAWHIQSTWDALLALTTPGGWHSHHIDLADHGSRDSNYIEMLTWPAWAYWMTMRFIPGAINRWRAIDHLTYFKKHELLILQADRELRSVLPVDRKNLAMPFFNMDETELKTTGIDLVARCGD